MGSIPTVTAWKRTLASRVDRTRSPVQVGRWLGLISATREGDVMGEVKEYDGGVGLSPDGESKLSESLPSMIRLPPRFDS